MTQNIVFWSRDVHASCPVEVSFECRHLESDLDSDKNTTERWLLRLAQTPNSGKFFSKHQGSCWPFFLRWWPSIKKMTMIDQSGRFDVMKLIIFVSNIGNRLLICPRNVFNWSKSVRMSITFSAEVVCRLQTNDPTTTDFFPKRESRTFFLYVREKNTHVPTEFALS